MIVTNIFLDVLAEREPFYADSKAVLELCENKKVYGFLFAFSATDIFYLIQRLYNLRFKFLLISFCTSFCLF